MFENIVKMISENLGDNANLLKSNQVITVHHMLHIHHVWHHLNHLKGFCNSKVAEIPLNDHPYGRTDYPLPDHISA